VSCRNVEAIATTEPRYCLGLEIAVQPEAIATTEPHHCLNNRRDRTWRVKGLASARTPTLAASSAGPLTRQATRDHRTKP